MKPYGIISDTHNHNWDLFSTTDEAGINSRLKIILNETQRAAQLVKDMGGDTLYHAGDLFHVRGKIAPSVLNPTIETYRKIVNDMGINVVVIPGNHDLETKDSSFYMSASSALYDAGVLIADEVRVVNNVVLIPWMKSVDELKEVLEREARSDLDCIIHAPVNGVIMGIPDHGLDNTYLARLAFKRIFAGHYHNHKDFGNGVYSVGALTHQTWSDVGSKAGFLTVTDDVVEWRSSHAPQFIDADPNWDESEVPLIVDGHYVRAKMKIKKESDAAAMRKFFMESGAAGVVIHPVREPKNTIKRAANINVGASIEASIEDYIKSKSYQHQAELSKLCQEILSEAV